VHAFEVKMYIPVVFKLLVSCGAEGYVSGLQDAALLALFLACRGWVTEGQFKKGVRVFCRESLCLLGGGAGCGTAQKGVTCSRVGGA